MCRGRVGQSPRVCPRRRNAIPLPPARPPPAVSFPSDRTTANQRAHAHLVSRLHQITSRSGQNASQVQVTEPGSSVWATAGSGSGSGSGSGGSGGSGGGGRRRPVAAAARLLASFDDEDEDDSDEDEESDSEEEGWAFGSMRRGYPW